MQASAAPLRAFDQLRNANRPGRIDDVLRRFDHQLDPDRPCFEAVTSFRLIEKFNQFADLFRVGDLRKRDHEIIGKAARLLEQRSQKQIQCPRRPRAKCFRERFDSNSDERRKAGLPHPPRQQLRRGRCVPVFFRVRPISVAVLEIDSKILHWLALQLGDGALEDRIRNFARQSQACGEGRRVGSVVANQFERERAQARGSLGLVKLSAAVNNMNWLSIRRD